MEWSERALVLGVKKHGETSVILEVMTRGHGRHVGVVRSGRSKTMQPVLQPGNEVAATWRARLEDHIGAFVVEPLTLRTHLLMGDVRALHGVNWLGGLLRLLPERDPHQNLFDMAAALLAHLCDPLAPSLLVRFELALLADLGFGLDLEKCAATGTTDNLIYVSPKSGRAVSGEAGAPWADRLLPLPSFLREGPGASPSPDAIRDALRLTGFFLDRDVFAPRGLKPPDSRAAYLAGL
ncbi:DNA repair protein RecO [Rhodoblastus sphagnicola]|uniref:DNA repair protein RecO n=1 Tax=Rhodoblastus sphagnicola TaxID=333368 RepID=A0A2S6NCW9_9HYPH|nr:DNA repair protein RecO [Rhodoblastus sphagnicola]MBB4196289.1 DNA repair protein RecO (recombination protein O) [Rhodoblastus sphagnicola]PPQ32431.1 DNA repair protein RecO [Rhodoblastus sphagnicola]